MPRKSDRSCDPYLTSQLSCVSRDKMYKGRLKTWGLMKNLKSKDAEKIMGMAKTGIATGPLVIRGRNMGSKKWQKRLNRVVAPAEESTSLVASKKQNILGSLPLPGHLAAPDTFRLTEAGLQAIRDFTTLQFSTQSWNLSGLPYDFDSDKTDSWSNGTTLATRNLIKDRSSADNFAILSKCFEGYAAVVDQSTPGLVPLTINNIIELLRVGPEIADELLRYVSQLVSIKLGESHPLSRFLSQLQTLGAVQIPLVSRAILSAYFDIIVQNSHPANRWRSAMYPTYAKMMQRWGALPREAVTSIFANTINGIEVALSQLDPISTDPSESDELNRLLNEVKGYYLVYLMDQGRFVEADQIVEEMGQWIRGGGASKYPEQFEQWLRYRALTLVGLDRASEATTYFIQTYTLRRDRLGPRNPRTARSIGELEDHYRLLNDVEAAEKLHAEFEASFGDNS